MGDPHPNREILSRFAEGGLPSDEARRIDQHLAVCSECRDEADEASVVAQLQFLESLLDPGGYDEAFDRAAARAAERLAGLRAESASTEDLFAELLREPHATRRHRVFAEERFHSLKLCQLLQARSRENWFANPSAALEWAELAVVAAQRLDPARYGSSLVEDARAVSWAYVGNANRILSDLRRAERALRQAWLHHFQAGEDVTTETELLSVTSSLRITQSRYEEAIRFADRAIALYREGQQPQAEGVTLVQKGLALTYDRRYQEAIPAIRLGLSRMSDEVSHPVLIGKHNLISCLFEEGDLKGTLDLLAESRPLYEAIGDLMTLARRRWLEGRLAASLGKLRDAETALLQARETFVERQGGLEVFLISLDLAHVYLLAGKRRQARELLREAIPLGERVGGTAQEILLARWFYEQASRR